MSNSTSDTRRANLKAMVALHSSIAAFAKTYGVDPTYVSQMLNGHRSIGEKSARNMESKTGKPFGWMDTPHAPDADSSPVATSPAQQMGCVDAGYPPEPPHERDYALIPQYHVSGECGSGYLNSHEEVKGGLAFKRDWLAHLSAMGLPLKHGKLHALRDRLSRHGLALTEAGEVRMLAPQSQGQHAIASAISALLNVAEWEREQLGVHDHANDLADLAELYLRQWKPGAPLQRHAKIKGQSNKEYTFDYYLDGEYIDIVAANHTATGAALRKAGDIKNSPWLENREIRFIIDDRTDPDKAETERQIMGALAKAMMFSRLQTLGESPVKH